MSDVHVLICLCRSNAVIHVVSDLYGDNGGRVPSGKLPTAALYEEYPCAFFLRHTQDTSLSAQRGARVGELPEMPLDFYIWGHLAAVFSKGRRSTVLCRHSVPS